MKGRSSLPFASILKPAGAGTGRAYVLLHSRHQSAWLLPAGSALRRHAGLTAFGYGGVKGLAARALVATRLLQGKHVWLDTASLERALAAAVGTDHARLAFFVGTPAASRKLTAQVKDRRDQVVAYAKLAADAVARESLRREHETLARLAKVEGLRDSVPRVLGWFRWHNVQGLVVTPGTGRIGWGPLTHQHTMFLRRLQDAFVEEAPFEGSAMWTRMTATLNRVAPRAPVEWGLRWRRSLALLKAALGSVVLPLSLAHRDFAPWNTRIGPQGLFVFDWETAADGMIPLYDAFHFRAVQAARAERPFRLSGGSGHDIVAALGDRWNGHLSHLYLAYLVDISLVRGEAKLLGSPCSDREWQWLGRHLDGWREDARAVA